MPTRNIKQEAHRLIERLPEDATWEDLIQHEAVPKIKQNRVSWFDQLTTNVSERSW